MNYQLIMSIVNNKKATPKGGFSNNILIFIKPV